MITINKEKLKSLRPCIHRWENYLKHYSEFEGTLEDFLALDKITNGDKLFVIKKIINTKHLVAWSQKCAESVSKFKNSRADADAARAAAADAADAAYAAAYAAYDARAARAAAAAYAAAYAAYDARAARAARAANAAAYAAAYAAADADADAAADTYAYAAADAAQWELNFKLLVQVVEELNLSFF